MVNGLWLAADSAAQQAVAPSCGAAVRAALLALKASGCCPAVAVGPVDTARNGDPQAQCFAFQGGEPSSGGNTPSSEANATARGLR